MTGKCDSGVIMTLTQDEFELLRAAAQVGNCAASGGSIRDEDMNLLRAAPRALWRSLGVALYGEDEIRAAEVEMMTRLETVGRA